MEAENVALLAEGVDRNIEDIDDAILNPVALLAEGVDRNRKQYVWTKDEKGSPSSRRAWIEIKSTHYQSEHMLSRPPRGGRG